jgi:uncharacterized RDD family membrane protein YckC
MESTETPDVLAHELQLVYASQGKRFANYLIDLVFFYVLLAIIGAVISIISPDTFQNITDNSSGSDLLLRLVGMVVYAIFMSLIEAISGGRTMGKIITSTRAVNEDGSKISFGTAFARGFTRAVPFNAFSALNGGHPWHDRWTHTMVIDEKLSDPLMFVVEGK